MHNEKFTLCIQACDDCAAACDHCSVACLHEPNVKMMTRCVALDMDCAAICRLAAGALARGSEHIVGICALFAEICQACADECIRHPMEHCQDCAKACQHCADECRSMVQFQTHQLTAAVAAVPITP